MTFATPWVFGAAVMGALLAGVLHLLSVRQPPVLALPTARFVTAGDAHAVARRPRPNDLLLLLMRVLALLASGAALAGVQFESGRARTVHLIMVDSAIVTDSTAWRDAMASDSMRAEVEWQVHAVAGLADDPGRALVAATGMAAAIAFDRATLEQVALTVLMPDTVETLDGWRAWRARWPGAVKVRRAAATPDPMRQVRTMSDAPVRAGDVHEAAMTALVATAGRNALPDDVTLYWPASGVPEGWSRTRLPDTVSAVAAGGQALVGPFVRAALPARTYDRALAWWSDGRVAATEQRDGARCIRRVGVAVPPGSDLLLSPPARGLLQVLRAPCGAAGVSTEPLRASTATSGDTTAAKASAFRVGPRSRLGTNPTWLAPVLLVMALLLLGAEWVLRRGEVVS